MELLFSADNAAAAVSNPAQPLPPLADLAAVLERAAKAARALSLSPPEAKTTAVASLHDAHRVLGSALAQLDPLPLSIKDEHMSDADGEESRIIEEVEEGMRECVLQSKRRKRPLSPSWTAGRVADGGEELVVVDAEEHRRAAVELVLQFHA